MQTGYRVVITAASSSVGLGAIQIENQIVAIPIAVTRSSGKREALMAAGAHHVIATDQENVLSGAGRILGGSAAPVPMTVHTSASSASLRLLKHTAAVFALILLPTASHIESGAFHTSACVCCALVEWVSAGHGWR